MIKKNNIKNNFIKKMWVLAFLLLIFILPMAYASTLGVYVRPKTDSGALQTSTSFSYNFLFGVNENCTDEMLNISKTITTDAYGVGFAELDISSLTSAPRYQCEYRDGSLRAVHNLSTGLFNNLFVGDSLVVNNSITANNLIIAYDANATSFYQNGNILFDHTGAIDGNNITDGSITAAELGTNSVADDEIDYTAVTLADFTDDVGYVNEAGDTINGELFINGNLTVIGDYITANVTTQNLNGSFYPEINNLFDLGSLVSKWHELFVTFINATTILQNGNLVADYSGGWNADNLTDSTIRAEKIITNGVGADEFNSSDTALEDEVEAFIFDADAETFQATITLNDNDEGSGDVNLVIGDASESGTITTNGGTITGDLACSSSGCVSADDVANDLSCTDIGTALTSTCVSSATDANTLDTIDSLSFLRSDIADSFTGTLTGGANTNLLVTDGSICADDTAGTCSGSTDGYIYADDFICNDGNCISAADIANDLSCTDIGTSLTSACVASAVDAGTLDTIDSLSFLRSDTADSFSGVITAGANLVIGSNKCIEFSTDSISTSICYSGEATEDLELRGDDDVVITADDDIILNSTGDNVQIGGSTSDSTDLNIIDGILRVYSNGDYSIEYASSDGEAYIEGELEVDGTIYTSSLMANTVLDWNGLTSSGSTGMCWGDAAGPDLFYDCASAPGDYAEWYRVANQEEVVPGDVICLIAEENFQLNKHFAITKKIDGCTYFGVVSTDPYLKIGEDVFPLEIVDKEIFGNKTVFSYSNYTFAAINLAGRSPVNVIGKINAGDRLTPAENGTAKSLAENESGQVIGVALEPLDEGKWNMIAQSYWYTAPNEINILKSELDQLKVALCILSPQLDLCQ